MIFDLCKRQFSFSRESTTAFNSTVNDGLRTDKSKDNTLQRDKVGISTHDMIRMAQQYYRVRNTITIHFFLERDQKRGNNGDFILYHSISNISYYHNNIQYKSTFYHQNSLPNISQIIAIFYNFFAKFIITSSMPRSSLEIVLTKILLYLFCFMQK